MKTTEAPATAAGNRHTFTSEADWLAFRRNCITATDAAAILGLSPHRTALDVYAEKLGAEGVADNEALRRGRKLERYLLDWYADERGVELIVPGDERVIYTHPALPWLSFSPDAEAVPDGRPAWIVEAKSRRSREGWGEPGTDEVPLDVLVQVVVGMACRGVSLAEIPVGFSFDDVRWYAVERDPGVEAGVIAKLAAWREAYWPPKPPPAFDGSEGGDRVIRQLWPTHRDPGVMAQPGDALDSLVRALRDARVRRDAAEADVSTMEQSIKALLQAAEAATGKGWRISWRQTKPRECVDREALVGALAGELSERIGVPAAQRLVADVTARCTSSKPGARPFKFTYEES